jgi:hypothetical protein
MHYIAKQQDKVKEEGCRIIKERETRKGKYSVQCQSSSSSRTFRVERRCGVRKRKRNRQTCVTGARMLILGHVRYWLSQRQASSSSHSWFSSLASEGTCSCGGGDLSRSSRCGRGPRRRAST